MAHGDPQFLGASPARRVTAVLAVGRFGSAADVPTLEPLLEDNTDYLPTRVANLPQGPIYPVQVRDVALAVLLHLTGQEPFDYGLVHARPHPLTVYDATSLGMENDARRTAAIAQWRAWKNQHPIDLAPVR
jgi:hypothetical protein